MPEPDSSTPPQPSAKKRIAPMVLRGILIASFIIMPWFQVRGLGSFNLFSITAGLSQISSIASDLTSAVGASSSVPSGLAATSVFALALAIVPVVRMGFEIYRYNSSGVSSSLGPGLALLAMFLGVGIAFSMNSAATNIMSELTSSTMSVNLVSIEFGWWISLLVAAATILSDHDKS